MISNLDKKITHLVRLGEYLRTNDQVKEAVARAAYSNPWFIDTFVRESVDAIATQMLTEVKLREWTARYTIPADELADKTIGIIMAGNLPLVGFHDFLCAYICGCKINIKLSGKDDTLFPFVLNALCEIDADLRPRVKLIEKLEGFDAVIATGSSNTHRYFEYYFKQYPSILRKNRNSVAILTGQETDTELDGLADDIFMYFGFGCRNVSKLYVPECYDITQLFPHFDKYKWMHSHTKYMNNYDYNRTLLLMNRTPHLANEILMMQESAAISSPVGVVFYEQYSSIDGLMAKINSDSEHIQCVAVGTHMFDIVKLTNLVQIGHTQQPELWDYADGADTLQFILSLKSSK
jgi:hypothetical protein